MSSSTKIKMRCLYNSELRALYKMDDKPKKWKSLMDKHRDVVGEPDGTLYDVRQVLIIFAKCGIPDEYLPDELEQKVREMNEELRKSA